MRSPRIPLTLLAAGGLAVAGASAPGATAAGWSAAPSVDASTVRLGAAAVADDGTATIVTNAESGIVVRTRAGSGGAWKVHRIPGRSTPQFGGDLAVGPGGAVLVIRPAAVSGVDADGNTATAKTVEVDVRATADGPWKHLSIPAPQFYSEGVAAAFDPTGGWQLAYERLPGKLGGDPVHVVTQHLDAAGNPDAPEQDLGRGNVGPLTDRTLQVDATGRAVLATAEDTPDQRSNVHVRPHGGTFGPPLPFGPAKTFFRDFGVRTSSAGRTVVAGDTGDGTGAVASGLAGADPGTAVTAVDGNFVGVFDGAPVGTDLAASVWTTDREDDCGASGRACKGRGGGLVSRVLAPSGLRPAARLARAGVQAPAITPLSGGRALVAWEQLGATGSRSTWHARIVGPTGRISPLSAPARAGSQGGASGVVRSAGRWALTAWPSGSGKQQRIRVAIRRF
ncbi:hypothetical protein [Patulibacter minatonensis]|uniref:hypothetical protein n=1 Tax=Patulibacter minatonensis TaxID=298163 RepID=UPI000479F2C7|nr:hypothetical protein [Patulibacter minatonensis]